MARSSAARAAARRIRRREALAEARASALAEALAAEAALEAGYAAARADAADREYRRLSRPLGMSPREGGACPAKWANSLTPSERAARARDDRHDLLLGAIGADFDVLGALVAPEQGEEQ